MQAKSGIRKAPSSYGLTSDLQLENESIIFYEDGLVVTNTTKHPFQKIESENTPTLGSDKTSKPKTKRTSPGEMTKMHMELFSLVFNSDDDSTEQKTQEEKI